MGTKLEHSGNRRHNFFRDEETLKREEWNRRRLLRIEQVRQQSRDIASLVRQKVQIERGKQLGLVQQRVKAKSQRQQVRKLRALHSEYESTLQNVGKSHAEAANQPNEQLIRAAQAARNLDAAQRRGQEALASLREEEASYRKADDQRRALQLQVRTLEDSRSAAVVALPIPETTVRPKSPPRKNVVTVSIPLAKTSKSPINLQQGKGDIPTWPQKSWPQSILPLGVTPSEETFPKPVKNDTSAGDTIPNPPQAIPGYFVPRESRFQDVELQEKLRSEEDFALKKSSNISEPLIQSSEVKLYDHRNLYQNQYYKPHGLAEKIEAVGELVDARTLAEQENRLNPSALESKLSLAERERKRSQQALQRVQTQHDYKKLMKNLSVLTKQKASFITVTVPSENCENNKEKKLLTAVEDLLSGSTVDVGSGASQTSLETPDGSLLISKLETPGSEPKLNVGRSEDPQQTPIRSFSPEEPVVFDDPLPEPAITRPSNSSLQSLLQRINLERNFLLNASHDIQGSSLERSKQEEVKVLSKRVQQQHQQLEEQHSIVQRLDASITVPDCNEGTGHDSHIAPCLIKSSCSDVSSELDTSSSGSSIDKTRKKDHAYRKRKKRAEKENKRVCPESPVKEGVVYSMDVSLSSVIMDHSTSSTSTSQSVSVHGVQVLVKVLESDEQCSLRSSVESVQDPNLRRKIDPHTAKDKDSCGKKEPQPVLENKSSSKLSHHHKSLHTGSKIQTVKRKESKPLSTKPTGKYSSTLRLRGTNTIDTKRDFKVKSDDAREQSTTAAQVEDYPKRKNCVLESHLEENKYKETVQQSERQGEPTSSSTSYFSPPERVLSSLTKDIQSLLAIAQKSTPFHECIDQRKKRKFHSNPFLLQYISRLLSMSRESIDKLHVECSEVPTPSSAIFCSSGTESGIDLNKDESATSENPPLNPPSEDMCQSTPQILNVTDSAPSIQRSIVNDDSDLHSYERNEVGQSLHFNIEESTLSDLTKQCHDKISTLNRMIEEVRRQESYDYQNIQNTQRNNLGHSPYALDSTGYFSPPPEVHEWTDIVKLRERNNELDPKDDYDPYASAVMKLLADVRSEMTEQKVSVSGGGIGQTSSSYEHRENSPNHEEKATSRPKPPVAFWRNLDRCNISSPTEPHELSTIPELAATLPDSSGFASPVRDVGTPPDVIAELLRRNILTSPFAWAKEQHQETVEPTSNSNISHQNSRESDLSSAQSGTGKSDISASKETNTVSFKSRSSSSNCSSNFKTNILLSPIDLCSSTDEVEGDFRKLGIGWVGAMLRKSKEAGALSSSSSSEGAALRAVSKPTDVNQSKDISDILDSDIIFSSSVAPPVYHGRGHSTPVKQPIGSNGSGSLSDVG